MFYYITLPFATVYDYLRHAFRGLFPLGGLWPLVATGIFCLLVLTALYFAFKFLVPYYKRDERIKSVAGNLTYPHILAGVYVDIVMLVEPEGAWNVIAHIVYIVWLLAFLEYLGLMAHEASQAEDAPHGQGYYWGVGILYGVIMFVWGLYAFMTAFVAIVLTIIIVVGVAFFSAGLRANLMSHIRGSWSSGGGSSARTATLEDGTVIKESGTNWYAENGNGTYHQNFDGSFRRAD